MNKISGKVVVKESTVGVPNLLVVVHDSDTYIEPATVLAPRGNGSGARLGSVLTDSAGAFELTYEDRDLRAPKDQERRPDLCVSVLAPEEPGKDVASRVLYTSAAPRAHAARTEQYLVRLPTVDLEGAGVPLPTTPAGQVEEAGRVVQRLTRSDARLAAIEDGVRSIDRTRVGRVREVTTKFDTAVRPALRKHLSRVPEQLLEPGRFVAPGESVSAKSSAEIRRGIEQVVNSDDPRVRAPVKRYVALTAAQKQALGDRLDENGAIGADALNEVLHGDAPPRPTTFLLRDDPVAQFCREKSHPESECLVPLGGDGGGETGGGDGNGGNDGVVIEATRPDTGGDVPGDGVKPLEPADIPRFAALLMDTMTSPEERVVTGLEPRADRTTVEHDLRNLAFPPSPADTPAFYDFHNLQIAFKHVWQEAIDEGAIDLAQDAYTDIVALGGDPKRIDGGADVVRAIRGEARRVLTARRRRNDPDVPAGGVPRPRPGLPPPGGATAPDPSGGIVVRDHRHHNGTPAQPADRLPDILQELEDRLKEDYAFTIYAANRKERSVNFGVVATYRQKWEPLAYQAGKLVKTITLAPKETQKYSKKTVIQRKRAEKEVEKHLSTRREEVQQTSRAEEEVVRKALAKTNFSLTTEGSYNIGIGEGTATTSFGRDASRTSNDVKKAFHEAVFKAAQEYKDEYSTEVNTEETDRTELVKSGEITNPNDEIAVTFMFYELQRRYRTSEHIHRLTPVVLVAQEVPAPEEIDEAWLLTYDWVLRRALLDDSFTPALNYLSQNVVGDAAALSQMHRDVEQQRRIVDELRQELAAVRDRADALRGLLERSLFQQANVVRDHRGGGGGFSLPIVGDIPVVGDVAEGAIGAASDLVTGAAEALGGFLFGGGDGTAGQTRQDALKEAMQRATDEARDLLFRLEREVTALNKSAGDYTKALAEHLNHRAQIARLRVHVKQNILYYMQAIWSYEPPDQRFFRLHQVPVPTLKASRQSYTFGTLDPARGVLAARAHRRLGLHREAASDLYSADVKTNVNADFEFTTLAEAAELDNLLGFKGNYMIFPLKESNALTDYMMAPYAVAGFDELVDPDDLGNWSLEEFARYVCCLKANLSDAQFAEIKDELAAQYARLLAAPRRDDEVITTPTQSLFIEALPAGHSLIEEFKAQHRAIDVKKVQAEVRHDELENLRRTARLLAGERGDPDIEKKIIVEGNAGVVVPSSDG